MYLFEGFRNGSVGFAALGGLLVAFSGLNTWRRQHQSVRDDSHARRLLRKLDDLEDVFASSRSPFMDGSEMVSALVKPGHTSDESWSMIKKHGDHRASVAAYRARLGRR